jgi:hypothetical protein
LFLLCNVARIFSSQFISTHQEITATSCATNAGVVDADDDADDDVGVAGAAGAIVLVDAAPDSDDESVVSGPGDGGTTAGGAIGDSTMVSAAILLLSMSSRAPR